MQLIEEIYANIKELERITGKEFGDATLIHYLVSVRSGARAINARYDGYNIKFRFK